MLNAFIVILITVNACMALLNLYIAIGSHSLEGRSHAETLCLLFTIITLQLSLMLPT